MVTIIRICSPVINILSSPQKPIKEEEPAAEHEGGVVPLWSCSRIICTCIGETHCPRCLQEPSCFSISAQQEGAARVVEWIQQPLAEPEAGNEGKPDRTSMNSGNCILLEAGNND
ncbi:uncharacterized protein LOC135384104 isoform X2 [Ornithodoros turicata]|uniref:uncharacterized protein LOC135384104 isoform X2 n=1 Tax=Ornithodoros turicata TaxID=34597 RepID=UPI003138E1EA